VEIPVDFAGHLGVDKDEGVGAGDVGERGREENPGNHARERDGILLEKRQPPIHRLNADRIAICPKFLNPKKIPKPILPYPPNWPKTKL
jgi:hypothetical protein